MNNDRGDVASNSICCTELPVSDPRLTNDMSKPIIIQQQQQRQEAKTLPKPFQVSQHQPIMSQYSDSSSPSYPIQSECGSTLYSSL